MSRRMHSPAVTPGQARIRALLTIWKRLERGCVADQPQQPCGTDRIRDYSGLRLFERAAAGARHTAALRWRRTDTFGAVAVIARLLTFVLLLGWSINLRAVAASTGYRAFDLGTRAYAEGRFSEAAAAFQESVSVEPASGAFQNLGHTEWRRGRVGAAVLAWEQAVWVDPANADAVNNLRFARESAQLPAPELSWFELASTWLPVNSWVWIAGASLWLAVGMVVLPVVLRWKRADWPQAVAACGSAVFLLCLPAHIGVHTRSKIGFVVQRDVPLRITPTREGEAMTRLADGEPVRLVRWRGDYAWVRTQRGEGWLLREEFALVCGRE